MLNQEIFDLLQVRLKTAVNADEALINLFEQNGKIIHVHKKQLLVISGTMDDNSYFIAKGAFLMSVVTDKGIAKTTSFYLDHYNDFISCSDTVYLHTPTIYQVMAVEDSVVIRFSRKFINHLLESDHKFLTYFLNERQILSAIVNKIRDARLALSSVEFLDFLYDQYPMIFQRFPSQNIAEFMGITPVWLSNLKRRRQLS
jgi:CRP-like cAMP-binding protein